MRRRLVVGSVNIGTVEMLLANGDHLPTNNIQRVGVADNLFVLRQHVYAHFAFYMRLAIPPDEYCRDTHYDR